MLARVSARFELARVRVISGFDCNFNLNCKFNVDVTRRKLVSKSKNIMNLV